MSSSIKFIDSTKSQFFSTVKQRVDQYFKERNLSKNADGLMYFKTVFYLGGLITFYSLIMFGEFSLGTKLLFSVGLGTFAAFIGFNICHDAIHGSYSSNDTVNRTLGFLFNVIGANSYVWSITHNVVHHMYTNIPGHDEDIEVAPGLLRLSPEDEVKKIQRYQHFYAFFLYSLASLSWVFRKDYLKFFKKRIGGYSNENPPKVEVFNLFFFKGVHYILFIILPAIVLGLTWWQFIIGFVAMHLAEGLVLGLVFQLAHVVEGTDFPYVNEEGNIEEAWAIHQMRTTANFASKSFMATFLCGGLNMQVEHHLFPKICHTHYPKISHIVRKTAEEFNVPYIENKTFIGALKSHYKMLKKFGIDEQKQMAQAKLKVKAAA